MREIAPWRIGRIFKDSLAPSGQGVLAIHDKMCYSKKESVCKGGLDAGAYFCSGPGKAGNADRVRIFSCAGVLFEILRARI